jgi:hypothetical protein
MAAKSSPGDGTHGHGVKGGRSGSVGMRVGPIQFLRELVRGLWSLHRS